MTAEQKQADTLLTVTAAFNRFIEAAIQAQDAPCAAMEHMASGIVLLKSLLPDWQPWDAESADVVLEAEEHIAMLNPGYTYRDQDHQATARRLV